MGASQQDYHGLAVNLKSWPKNSVKIHKNREKNLQFFGVNDFKIRWMVSEIKLIKGKNFNENKKK